MDLAWRVDHARGTVLALVPNAPAPVRAASTCAAREHAAPVAGEIENRAAAWRSRNPKVVITATEIGSHNDEVEFAFPPRSSLRHALLSSVFAFIGAGDPGTRFKELGHQLMCICGCGQILLECNHVGCPDSDGMRNELMAAVTRGDSDSLVEQAFVQKYGPTVLAAPTGTGFDRTAWIMPFVALFARIRHCRVRDSCMEKSASTGAG